MKSSNDSSWNLYSWAILVLFTFFQIMQWPLSPKFLDIYYHLCVVKGFHDAGGYVTNAFWEYAPGGRPHLYPPLLHVFMLFFYEMGVPAIDVGRLVDFLSYLLLLFAFWRFVRKIHGSRLAFLALLIFSSSYSICLASITLPAFNLAFILALLALEKLENGQVFSTGLFLGLGFYTHTWMAWLTVFLLCIRAMQEPRMRRQVFLATLLGVFLGAPFLIYQFQHRHYFELVSVKENRWMEWDLGIYGMVLSGFIIFRGKSNKKSYAIPLALWLCMTPLLLGRPARFFYGHGLTGASWLAALFLDTFLERGLGRISLSRPKWQAAGLLTSALFFLLFAPILRISFETKKVSIAWTDRSLIRFLWPDSARNFESKGFSIYFQKDYEKLVQVIRDNSTKGDIIWTDFSYTAGILGILSDRETSCAMLAEVKPYEKRNHLLDANIVVWFKDQNARPLAEMFDAAKRYGFILLKETDMAYVYKNPGVRNKAIVPSHLISSQVLFLTIFGLLFLAFFGFPKIQPKRK